MNQNFSDNDNMALIAAVVAVATIGGLMFGYDSGVINGTQEVSTPVSISESSGLVSRSVRSFSAPRSALFVPDEWPN